MAGSHYQPSAEPAPFEERRTLGRVIPFRADFAATDAPSPARLLQEQLELRARDDLYIVDPAARRLALLRFVFAGALMWGVVFSAIALLMHAAS